MKDDPKHAAASDGFDDFLDNLKNQALSKPMMQSWPVKGARSYDSNTMSPIAGGPNVKTMGLGGDDDDHDMDEDMGRGSPGSDDGGLGNMDGGDTIEDDDDIDMGLIGGKSKSLKPSKTGHVPHNCDINAIDASEEKLFQEAKTKADAEAKAKADVKAQAKKVEKEAEKAAKKAMKDEEKAVKQKAEKEAKDEAKRLKDEAKAEAKENARRAKIGKMYAEKEKENPGSVFGTGGGGSGGEKPKGKAKAKAKGSKK